MFASLKKSAPVLAKFVMLAGLVLLPSAASAQKEQFTRSKPHVNVSGSGVGATTNILPTQPLPPPNPPSPMGKPAK